MKQQKLHLLGFFMGCPIYIEETNFKLTPQLIAMVQREMEITERKRWKKVQKK